MTRFILTFIALTAFSNAATAQGSSGTPQDRAACRESVKRFCTSAIQGGDLVVLSCLQQNRARISKECQQVLMTYGQ